MQELHEFAFDGPEVEERFLRDAQDAEMDEGLQEGEVGGRVGHASFFVLGSWFFGGESFSRRGAGAQRGVGGNGKAEAALQAADVDRRAVQAGAEVGECVGGGHGWCVSVQSLFSMSKVQSRPRVPPYRTYGAKGPVLVKRTNSSRRERLRLQRDMHSTFGNDRFLSCRQDHIRI
jgi:hypothetical protein